MLKEVFLFIAVLALTNGENYGLSRSGARNTYTLYTKADIRQPYPISSSADLQGTPFNESLISNFILHDHLGSGLTTLNPSLKDQLLTHEDVNVFVVDYSYYAQMGYENAVSAAPSIAEYLANFIQELIALGSVSANNIHLIGFGLGAHICGIAGRDLGGTVGRITGLDPTGKLWGAGSQRLSAADAKYVEVIHTDGSGFGNFGIGTALGHVDFFINGGGNQPGCLNHRCCHERAWEIMAASIGHNILGNKCNNMFQNNFNLCRGVTLPVGTNSVNKPGSGIYRANTRRTYPYV